MQALPDAANLFNPNPYNVAKRMVRKSHQDLAPIMNLLAAGEELTWALENTSTCSVYYFNVHECWYIVAHELSDSCWHPAAHVYEELGMSALKLHLKNVSF